MSRRLIALGICLAALSAPTALYAADNGAQEIMVDAGSKGSVYFPHRQHQETEGVTCQTCHELFPKEPGSISGLKAEGSLKPKQVMNSLCISCHKETAAAGKPSGPRSCSICHAK